MKKKRLDKTTIGIAAFLSLLLFLSGVFLGWNLNQQKIDVMNNRVEGINKDVENFQTEFLLLNFMGENASCPLLKNRLTSINKETYELGGRLTTHDEDARFENQEDLEDLKSSYYHSLIRYWLLSKRMKEKCDSNDFVTVLYFFDQDCDICSDQGFLLSYYKEDLGDNLLVFTLDASFDDPYIDTLERHHDIERFPSIVVDGKRYEGFQNKTQLSNIFCEKEPSFDICS